MAADRGLAPSTLLIALLVLGPALVGVGSGPMNGDAAAYLAQATAGVVADRWIHLGYLGPAALLGRFVDLPIALDGVSWGAAVVAVLAVARIAARDGGDPRLATILAAAVVMPWSPFAEVDLAWIAAVHLAVAGSELWIGVAVAISPAALLAVPWVVANRPDRGRRLVAVVLATVVGLTVVSGGAWWTGERGVLTTGAPALGRTAAAFGWHLPWLVVALVRPDGLRRMAWCLPLLLVPPDVPAWLVPGLAAACAARTGRFGVGVMVIQLGLAGGETAWRIGHVRRETRIVAEVVATLGPDDGLIAPWTWGARVAVAASGDPYGIPWHPSGRFLRDQHDRWCADPPERALLLPSREVWLDRAAIAAECVSSR